MTLRNYIFLLPIVALSACADDVLQSAWDIPADSSDDIRVGCGFYTGSDELSVESRATSGLGDVSPAEQLEWLRQPLFDGFEITYFPTPATGSNPSKKRMAKLQLVKKSGSTNEYETVAEEVNGTLKTLAKYNFKEIADGTVTDKNAKWFDNGKHTFQGIYAPDAILKYEAGSKIPSATLTSDQSAEGDGTNYTSLTQYSAMPNDQVINATVQRVLLPFQHRLARVFAYILIDPEMKGVTLEGYTYVTDSEGNVKQKDDPTTTSLRFENVKVLEYYAALGTILGHNFPIFMKFHGGKGIACTGGLMVAVCPICVPICLTIFLVTVLTVKYVSLGSILVCISFFIQILVFLPKCLGIYNCLVGNIGHIYS